MFIVLFSFISLFMVTGPIGIGGGSTGGGVGGGNRGGHVGGHVQGQRHVGGLGGEETNGTELGAGDGGICNNGEGDGDGGNEGLGAGVG